MLTRDKVPQEKLKSIKFTNVMYCWLKHSLLGVWATHPFLWEYLLLDCSSTELFWKVSEIPRKRHLWQRSYLAYFQTWRLANMQDMSYAMDVFWEFSANSLNSLFKKHSWWVTLNLCDSSLKISRKHLKEHFLVSAPLAYALHTLESVLKTAVL